MRTLIILIVILNVSTLFSQQYYKNYNVDNGLSQNNVTCILQDHLGFMWFGTEDGLNKFDGYSFYVYRRESDNNFSLGNNSVTSLAEDLYKNIWVGTQSGLYKYIRKENKFVRIKLPAVISQDNVISKMSIWGNNLWVGTANSSIHNINVKTEEVTTYLTVDEKGNSVVNNYIYSINAISDNIVLIGTKYTGLNVIYPQNKRIVYQKLTDENSGNDWKVNFVAVITKISENNVIINTDSNLPLLVDIKSFKGNPLVEKEYLSKFINGYCLDFVNDNENILIGSNNSYLLSYNLSTKKIKEYKDNFGRVKPFNIVNDIFIDKENCYWLATSGMGIFYYNPQIKKFASLFYVEEQKKACDLVV
ncbi:MAG TPA: two-component regulator propeller domain-containing protein [Melioribacteraceae bacterium]|nr:two-component regulator propeller domain-containing protein [Melioribacteraceae bacterium]